MGKALVPLLPDDYAGRDAAMRLVNALDDMVGRVAADSVLLAVVCAGLRELSGWTLARVAKLLADTTYRVIEVYQMSRLIQVGDLVSEYPALRDVRSFYRLLQLTKIPDDLKSEIFETGVINGCVDIRCASRHELEAAISILRGDDEEEIAYRSVRRDLGRARFAVAKALKALQRCGGGAELMASLQAANKMLEEELSKIVEVPLAQVANG
jgi:hypothetical protein